MDQYNADYFSSIIGSTARGLIKDSSHGCDTNILIFDSGCGLAFSSSWVVKPDELKRIIEKEQKRFEDNQKSLEYIINLAK